MLQYEKGQNNEAEVKNIVCAHKAEFVAPKT